MSRKLTEPQTAEKLNTATATLRRWRWAGVGPAYIKVGRLVRYDEDDLEAYLKSRRVEPTQSAA